MLVCTLLFQSDVLGAWGSERLGTVFDLLRLNSNHFFVVNLATFVTTRRIYQDCLYCTLSNNSFAYIFKRSVAVQLKIYAKIFGPFSAFPIMKTLSVNLNVSS